MNELLSERPDERAVQILEALQGTVDGDFYSFFRLELDEGRPVYTDMTCAGDPDASARWKAGEGDPLLASWAPVLPAPREVNVFRSGAKPRGAEVWRTAYEPFGLEHQRRMLLYDGEVFCGWIGVLRRGDRPFRPADDAALERATERIGALVRSHHGLVSRQRPRGGVQLLLGPRGELEMACEAGERWLRATGLESLAGWTRRLDAGREAPQRLVLGGARARVVRMQGSGGVRYLWTMTPLEPPRLDPLHELTPREREVCEFAAAGATATEIARHLGCSAETVKTHIKRAYRKLGVASRVELAERVQRSAS